MTVQRLAHRPGHLGRDQTNAQIAENFWWPGLDRDVQKLCTACDVCQRIRIVRKRLAPLQPLSVIPEPFQRVAMDFIGL